MAMNASGSSDQAKKRRGRPRKADVIGNLMVPLGSSIVSPPVMSAVSLPVISTVASRTMINAVASVPVVSASASMSMVRAVATLPLMSAVASLPMTTDVANSPSLISAIASPPVPLVVSTPHVFSFSHLAENSANRNQGRGHGRPPGSGNWQGLASQSELFMNTAVNDFTVHVIDVSPGEDVTAKIMSLIQNGPRGMVVLSAKGTLSSASISRPGSAGGVIAYEGHFEILSLNGSFTISESGVDVRYRRKGGFSVSLAYPNGQVIGGGVAGPLVAATPLKVFVGSFIPN